jgi:hypothetical protein
MGFLDNLSKSISQGVDRAKFEADKFQRTTRVQGELNDLKKQLDTKTQELGQRAYELFRAGQISAPSISALTQDMDDLQAEIIRKEEELKAAQAVAYTTPAPTAAGPVVQQVPITPDDPAPGAPDASATKACPNCGFQMPASAIFCPSCGARMSG